MPETAEDRALRYLSKGCPDIDGLPDVEIVTTAFCKRCGQEVGQTSTGWHHIQGCGPAS